MKHFFTAILLLILSVASAQNKDAPISVFSLSAEALSKIKLEDSHGHIITDPQQKLAILQQRQLLKEAEQTAQNRSVTTLVAVPLCSNGGFEEHEMVGSTAALKSFAYTTGDVLNPMQCRDLQASANSDIPQFNPGNPTAMARTVPANHIDEFIGNIQAFDQYALKINHKNSSTTISKVQGKRIKTDNETQLKFNYKAVLQVIDDSGHDGEQPFMKARVLNQSGMVVDEFCLIGTRENCIFREADVLDEGATVVYTPNWQSGILDISSIPNNQEFTIEFIGSRCGLGGHFGYTYVDDICLLHSNENLQGSITLDPLYKICPTLPLQVCGSFTIPNSGGISATIQSISLNVRNNGNSVVFTSTTPVIDMVNKTFCFDLQAANFPDVVNMGYNMAATINYGLLQTDCAGTNFEMATDDDANPGWDVWFLNCADCDIDLHTANLTICDTNHNGTEVFNLTNLNTLVTTSAGITSFDYYATVADATAGTNAIATPTAYTSPSTSVFIRANKSATCFKIIAVNLVVKNPIATITGILNVCGGSTILTASPGSSYLWGGGQTTQSITVNNIGTYTVAITDSFGCQSNGSVAILATTVAPQPDIVVTHPNCFSTTGTITVTSPASSYSFDNGTTWVTSNAMSNLPVGYHTIKIRTIGGCESYPLNVRINTFQLQRPHCTSVNPAFCGDTGSITITTPSPWYSFDDGLTWVATNTMSGLPSGTYNMRVKDAAGCISNYESIILNGEFLEQAEFEAQNPYCGNLGYITITTPAAAYSFDGGTTWQTSNILANLSIGSYIIKIKNSQGCTSQNKYVYLTHFENTTPTYTIDNAGCNKNGSITITALGDSFSFDNGATWSTNPILSNLTAPANYTIKIRKGLCESRATTVNFNSSFLPLPVVTDYEAFICDDTNDGSQQTNLSDYDVHLVATLTGFTFRYFKTQFAADSANGSQEIFNPTSHIANATNTEVYVRVTDANGCHSVARVGLNLLPTPVFEIGSAFPLCVGKTVTIDAGIGYHDYLWSTGENTHKIVIDEPGDYTVTVFNDHVTVNGVVRCATTRTFNIFLSDKAIITRVDTYDWTNYENALTVYVDGLGDYEYSLDGVHYQDSPTFTNLRTGDYTVYIHDKFECGTIDRDVFLLMYNKFFTPNEDTYNDGWKIEFSENEPGLTIDIFNRDGKLLKVLHNDEFWDGTYEGVDMHSDDYWFVVNRSNGKQHRGHFTLKR